MITEEMREKYVQKKSEKIDAFGLSKKTMQTEEEIQVTPYDAFCLEDSLRILHSQRELNEIKGKMQSRYDEGTGLYDVVVGDANTTYYHFATMFNRMKNPAYGKKVWRSVNLLNEIMSNIRKSYAEEIEKAISHHEFAEAMEREDGMHM